MKKEKVFIKGEVVKSEEIGVVKDDRKEHNNSSIRQGLHPEKSVPKDIN
jgi:hypothetical protein